MQLIGKQARASVDIGLCPVAPLGRGRGTMDTSKKGCGARLAGHRAMPADSVGTE